MTGPHFDLTGRVAVVTGGARGIAPAVIDTPLLDGVSKETIDYMVAKIPVGRVGTPSEVAALVHYVVSDECSFATGACFDASGGRCTY